MVARGPRRRRNGLVRVPKAWYEACVDAWQAGGSTLLALPLSEWTYPKLLPTLQQIYPVGYVPLAFTAGGLSPGVAGSTSTKGKKGGGIDGGYSIGIVSSLTLKSAASTILHELRHLVQHVGDEVTKKDHGNFGRPSLAAKASLRRTKKLVKGGKGPKGVDPYFTSASEWQPWVGSTADEIVGSILDAGLTGKLTAKQTAQRNTMILAGAKAGIFYKKTDPATRRELLGQVYTEVERQLAGTTHVPHLFASGPASQSSEAPKPAYMPDKPFRVMLKLKGAMSAASADKHYIGVGSGGSTKLLYRLDTLAEAQALAAKCAAQAVKGSTVYGGSIHSVRISGPGIVGEQSVYEAPKTNPKVANRVSVKPVYDAYPKGRPKERYGGKPPPPDSFAVTVDAHPVLLYAWCWRMP